MERRLIRILLILILVICIVTSFFNFLSFTTYMTQRDRHEQELIRVLQTVDLKGEALEIDTMSLMPMKDFDQEKGIYFTDASGTSYRLVKNPIYFLEMALLFAPVVFGILILFFIFVPKIAHEISKRALAPVIESASMIAGILSGERSLEEPFDAYKELTPYLKDIRLEKNQIEYSMNRLKENEKLRREFTANVTHELKTPLTSINGYAEMIAGGMTSPEDSKRFANIILSEGNRLSSLINEILQLSKVDSADPTTMDLEPFPLKPLVEENMERLSALANTKAIDMHIEGGSPQLVADRRMMDDLLANLISNAIKYNVEGGDITVTLSEDSDSVIIEVADTGIGIGPEDQERVFERFYVVNSARNKQTGTGLGLSLVKHIVKNHGGTLHLKSRLGVGTTFTVNLPKH